ncbi:Collagenase [Eumeta japonica]|uniref:Collagenase n=1 Tax=Eumeta variegata TaxID=151549 RepID=A0A4C1SXD3_EUMVA|nr:Collagenase [Eumeta japonica]
MKLLTFVSLALVVVNAFCTVLPPNVRQRNVNVPIKRKPQEDKKFPYQVGILLKDSESNESWCSGSLISEEFVLTAAHCVDEIEAATLYLGSPNRLSGEVTHEVSKTNFILHPKWNSDYIENDIALIRIPHTEYSENIKAVKLPSDNEAKSSYEHETVITSGWDHLFTTPNSLKNDLGWSFMPVISNQKCREYFGTIVKDTNICIGSYGYLSTCRGDTGGPLVLHSNMVQIGIASFRSSKDCKKGSASGFTRVTSYLNWIKSYANIVN